MNSSDIYKSGYKFAREDDKQRIRRLKLVTVGFLLVLTLVACFGFVDSLNLFSKKQESVQQVFEDQTDEEEAIIQAAIVQEAAYKEAKIPYDDPNGKFSIIFLTPYVSDQVAVVINSEKEYDESKKAADEIINAAKSKVLINSVTYIKNY